MRLPPQPDLDWSDESAPRATAFGDVYFSREGGLAESDAVFLAGCGLPDAWAAKTSFAVCELGFGTGLNVLALWRAWKKTRLPHAHLHICSIEAFPLGGTDAQRALRQFPEVEELAVQLLQRWPVRAYAPQRLWFEEDGLSLTLFVGEAEQVLAGLEGRFDAWLLDGFAPARNPAMWGAETFAQIARLSAPDARLATFTVAGDVRRGLESVGFAVDKKPGFGAKRERLEARRTASADASPPRTIYPYAASHLRRVAILGAGIAGAACAHALGQRGVETIVLEAEPGLGAGGSGNPAGLVMPRLDRGGVLSQFHIAAYLHAVDAYEALGVFERTGVEQRAAGERDSEALADLIADPPLPDDWFAGLGPAAALHKRAGLVRPQRAIEAMLKRAQLICESPVETLERTDGGWVLRAPDKRALLKADAVVLACGASLARFEPARFLPIELSRGQIEWGKGNSPPHAITRGSYAAPYEGGVLFGATFDKANDDQPPQPDEDSRRRNLAALAELAPEIAAGLDVATLTSRAALRATTPDRAPIAGLLPEADAWLAQYAALAHGGRIDASAAPPAHDGVYVIGGLGARGLTLAPMLGEIIAAEMFGEPPLLPQAARDALHPARFLHRALKRR
ncbi:MAG: bifunctional tRNA (5-methylaminomethyl-2-thiouridine)(34)-methyltransferase MnmD/FAD-dependent 5-carboxymethylaminomethyl-2-thiouridine(34) oxidoreductase MnmC [Hyphomonadaceae bacterium]|nr:bifunctional tRNA (5-methylaminomethyl-2-thiouridine)(34)-methyltransferase MnmD/FAD-dependent 5-carboxymethylaminomethyl-2-thiouridine(34) oxidoreductase MnmC [Hyphomonadaceae bacterium]